MRDSFESGMVDFADDNAFDLGVALGTIWRGLTV
jgi:hypothetical protein